MVDEHPKRSRSENESTQYTNLIGSRQEVSSTTNDEIPVSSRPKKK